ncbi:hypothetical protein [Halomonas sp. TD01]
MLLIQIGQILVTALSILKN